MSAAFASGGSTVYPGDVERVLLEHPAVADAALVAAPGLDGGLVGVAFVVLAPGRTVTQDGVLEFARARFPAHAAPASVAFIDRLPRSSVGKLLREPLRMMAAARTDRDAMPSLDEGPPDSGS